MWKSVRDGPTDIQTSKWKDTSAGERNSESMELESLPGLDTTTTKLHSIITGNIRGLNPGIHYGKIEYLKDLALDKKAFMITLTESHLSDGVSDS